MARGMEFRPGICIRISVFILQLKSLISTLCALHVACMRSSVNLEDKFCVDERTSFIFADLQNDLQLLRERFPGRYDAYIEATEHLLSTETVVNVTRTSSKYLSEKLLI